MVSTLQYKYIRKKISFLVTYILLISYISAPYDNLAFAQTSLRQKATLQTEDTRNGLELELNQSEEFAPNPITPTPIIGNLPRIKASSAGVSFDEYIRFQNVFRSETDEKIKKRFDLSPVFTLPEQVSKEMAAYRKLKPSRIDTIITRQSADTPLESIVELISNGLDATERQRRPIGRFGVGGLQVLSYILDPENPPLAEGGAEVVTETKAKDNPAYRIRFFKNKDLKLKFLTEDSARRDSGTTVSLRFHGKKDRIFLKKMEEYIRHNYSLCTRMPIYINGVLINGLDGYFYLDGGTLDYSSPNDRVDILLNREGVQVIDHGEGMDLNKIRNTYLIPREGRGIPKEIPTPEEIDKEIAFFYKAPKADKHTPSKMKVSLQISGRRTQSFEIEGIGLPEELVLELPSLSNYNVAHNEVIIDETTHIAARLFCQKLTDPEKTAVHKDALINAFLQTAAWLDKRNGRSQTGARILDEAKKLMASLVKIPGRTYSAQ